MTLAFGAGRAVLSGPGIALVPWLLLVRGVRSKWGVFLWSYVAGFLRLPGESVGDVSR
jgi:hypothetical protein